jgi:hypothetical protein
MKFDWAGQVGIVEIRSAAQGIPPRLPSRFNEVLHRDTAIPHGRVPTRIVPVTRLVRVSTMEMLLERSLAV